MNKINIKVGILVVFFLMVFSVIYFKLFKFAQISYWVSSHSKLMGWVNSHYFLAIIAYIVIFSLLLGFYMPFFDFSIILSGFLFGWDGIIYSSVIVVISSYILYLLGRILFTSIVDKWINKSSKVKGITHSILSQEKFSVFILRFLPLFPFQIITILCSILGIKKINFLFFSWIGYLPRMTIYVYIGIKLDQFFKNGDSSVNIWQSIPLKSILIILLLLGIFIIAGYVYMNKNRKKFN